MQELNLGCLIEIHKVIKGIDEDIMIIRERIEAPKNQIISDMPRGGISENAVDKALDEIKKKESRRLYYCDVLVSKWLICEEILKSCNINQKHIELLKFRFLQGLSWRACVKGMTKLYNEEKWNENKVFRIYRQVVAKCTKQGVKVC